MTKISELPAAPVVPAFTPAQEERIRELIAETAARRPMIQGTEEAVLRERVWRPMMQMPIGDHRNLLVQVRDQTGKAALAFWTGNMWAEVPLAGEITRLGFAPVEYCFVRPTPAGDDA